MSFTANEEPSFCLNYWKVVKLSSPRHKMEKGNGPSCEKLEQKPFLLDNYSIYL